MGRTFEGTLVGTGLRIAIVAARFNDLITRSLLEGARDGLHRHGVAAADVDVVWVPGSFEIPLVASSSRPGHGYLVHVDLDGTIGCTCPAAEWDFPCKHAASVRQLELQSTAAAA